MQIMRKDSLPFVDWGAGLAKAGLILLACLWVYSPVYHGDWLWDDDYLLTDNAVVQSPGGLWSLWFAPATADYFPLTMCALWLQWRFFGLDSTGYHIVSIVLHALGSCCVWMLLHHAKIRGAWLAGLLFAVHPLAVESVAWISELKNTFSLPFFLLAATFFVRFEEDRRRFFYFLALGFFLAAMLAKSSVVMLPCVMLLFIWWRRGEIKWRDILNTAPFFLISLVLGLVTLHFQHDRAIGSEPIPIGGIDSRLAIAGMAILFYISKILWPIPLVPIYPQWQANPPDILQFLPWIVIIGGIVLFWSRRNSWGRDVLMAFGFFLLMVLPVLGFVAMSYMRVGWVADHFIYIPMIGIVAYASALGTWAFEKAKPTLKPFFIIGVTALIFGLTILSYNYSEVWENEDNLWTYTLRHNPNSWQAHNRLGARQFNRGNTDPALSHFQEATRLRPDLAETQNNLGSALLAKRDTKGAVRHFSEALRLGPDIIAIQSNLANALFLDGQPANAAVLYGDLAKRFPQNPVFHCNFGVSLFQSGRIDEAIISFRRALEIDPQLQDALQNLKTALEKSETKSPR